MAISIVRRATPFITLLGLVLIATFVIFAMIDAVGRRIPPVQTIIQPGWQPGYGYPMVGATAPSPSQTYRLGYWECPEVINMKLGETAIIAATFHYSPTGDLWLPDVQIEEKDYSTVASASLKGIDFEIEPSNGQSRYFPIGTYFISAGTMAYLRDRETWYWQVKPKRTGSAELILDLSLLVNGPKDRACFRQPHRIIFVNVTADFWQRILGPFESESAREWARILFGPGFVLVVLGQLLSALQRRRDRD